jgi:hypothetical protein
VNAERLVPEALTIFEIGVLPRSGIFTPLVARNAPPFASHPASLPGMFHRPSSRRTGSSPTSRVFTTTWLISIFASGCGPESSEPVTRPSSSASVTATIAASSVVAQPSAPLPATSVTFNQIADAGILYQSCAQGACHVPDYQAPDLSNSKGDLFQILTKTPVTRCGNQVLVVPGVPAQSAILKLVRHQCANGWVMPPLVPQNPTIDESDVKAIESWIAAGAPH